MAQSDLIDLIDLRNDSRVPVLVICLCSVAPAVVDGLVDLGDNPPRVLGSTQGHWTARPRSGS